MDERQKQIEEILDFVTHHKNSLASINICARLLGDKFIQVDDEVIQELKVKLPRADSEELESFYYMIK
ncbi:MAG: hypothetical protein PWP45_15 [Tepidanaerobacteraceae bacterium]|uniref:Uncharacterized protein n=2 Tax=Thermosediminibacteraceae TaxID=2770093 RepID=A0A140LDC4_9FIRM|nr:MULTISPECIES: hypothetical protein [Thermosediminibacteraceae]KXG78549.1 hypothetical protein AN618_03050 [Fervidicola ferrireducens]MDN5330790.1 hypothetical protein [Tepidanaerobacteraceae bacterium]SHM04949.1 hypothetical protein SAMN05660826_00069 [Caldanaerovirga acetigignens]